MGSPSPFILADTAAGIPERIKRGDCKAKPNHSINVLSPCTVAEFIDPDFIPQSFILEFGYTKQK